MKLTKADSLLLKEAISSSSVAEKPDIPAEILSQNPIKPYKSEFPVLFLVIIIMVLFSDAFPWFYSAVFSRRFFWVQYVVCFHIVTIT
eukprot:snap_masked-scaffold_5-processed-gene-1.55-mRNA-1 protein AED:1.00 eAED:1.00 QI:0/0/0/0/1/1/2/0/87